MGLGVVKLLTKVLWPLITKVLLPLITKVLWPFIMKVGFPTFDVVGDGILFYTAYATGNPIWGSLLLLPMLVNFFFTFYSWMKHEQPENKRWSWVFLVLQVWPQLRAVYLIKLCWKEDPQYKKKQRAYDRYLGNLEPSIEAGPQTLIKWAILSMAFTKASGDCSAENSIDSVFGDSIFFKISMIVSMYVGVYSLAEIVSSGPCYVSLKSSKHPTIAKIFNLVSLICICMLTFQGKAFILSYSVMSGSCGSEAALRAIIGIFTLFLLPLIVSVAYMSKNLGFKSLIKIVLSFPTFIVTPAFSPLTFGTDKEGNVMASRRGSLLNFIASLIGIAACFGYDYSLRGETALYDLFWALGTVLGGVGWLIYLRPRSSLQLGVLRVSDLSEQLVFNSENGIETQEEL